MLRRELGSKQQSRVTVGTSEEHLTCVSYRGGTLFYRPSKGSLQPCTKDDPRISHTASNLPPMIRLSERVLVRTLSVVRHPGPWHDQGS